MQVEVLTREPDFLALEPAWNSLADASRNASIFSRFEWLSTWWQHFKAGKQLRVLVAREGGRVAGIAPFAIAPREGFRVLSLMGGRVSDYKDFIIDAGADRPAVLGQLIDSVYATRDWDLLQFDGLRDDSPNFNAIGALLERCAAHHPRRVQYEVSPCVPVRGTWQEYMRSLGKKFRYNARNSMALLIREQCDVTFTQPVGGAEVERFTRAMLQLKAERWHASNKGPNVLEFGALGDFYLAVAQRLFAAGLLTMPTLLVNGEVAAVDFGVEYANKHFACQHAMNEKFARYSVGSQLNLHVLEDAYSRGLDEVDMLLGEDSYKQHYRPELRKLYSVSLCRDGARGFLAERWFTGLRPVLERAASNGGPLRRVKQQISKAKVERG
jgi:CelD/BcsL family acetyltransferase involved in cellulose biosynthesis